MLLHDSLQRYRLLNVDRSNRLDSKDVNPLALPRQVDLCKVQRQRYSKFEDQSRKSAEFKRKDCLVDYADIAFYDVPQGESACS